MSFDIKEYFSKSYMPIYWECLNKIMGLLKKTVFIPILKFFSGPLSTMGLVILQLSLGAILGADISIKISKEIIYASFDFATICAFWDLLNPFTKYFFYFVVSASLVKSIFEITLSILEKNQKERFFKEAKSLPEKSVINYYYSEIIPEVQLISEECRESSNIDEIKNGILKLMSLTREFAAKWDSQSTDRFSCNLMFYFPVSELIMKQIAEGWEVIGVFFNASNPDSAAKQISGVFAVIASVNTSENFYLDASQKYDGTRLLLPVSDRDNKMHSRQYIPGAPEVFNLNNYQYLPDILLNISKWLNYEQADCFSPNQKEGIYNYYLNDKSNRSLLSLPCAVPFDISMGGGNEPNMVFNANQIVAVLNIYSIDKYMINGSPDIFYQFCKPLLTEIAKLCCAYEIIKGES